MLHVLRLKCKYKSLERKLCHEGHCTPLGLHFTWESLWKIIQGADYICVSSRKLSLVTSLENCYMKGQI